MYIIKCVSGYYRDTLFGPQFVKNKKFATCYNTKLTANKVANQIRQYLMMKCKVEKQ